MKRAYCLLCSALVLGLLGFAAIADDKPPSPPGGADRSQPGSPAKPGGESKAGLDFFEAKIRPVLVQKCYQCHSAAAKELKGGLLLDTRQGMRKGGDSGPAVVPRDVDASLIVEALRHDGLQMPPDEQLSESVADDFERWIKMGAPDPREGKALPRKKLDLAEARKFWAYQPIKKQPAPPTVKDAAWPRTDVDRFILAGLEAQNLHPVADVDRVTLLRRVYLDLTGLLPSSAEIDAFVADRSPDAFTQVVDRLLASPRFGERWGRHWLDVARFGESTGKDRNVPYPVAWKYRDYVIDSFNADKPYDRFIVEQVAGDLLPATTPEERNANRIATGLLALGPKSVNERDVELYLLDEADEQIDVVFRSVMATTASCARCHDHKFDPIPQTDYYALAGIFYKSTETMAGIVKRQQSFVIGRMLPLEATSAQLPSRQSSAAAAVVPSADSKEALRAQLERARSEIKVLAASRSKSTSGKDIKARAKALMDEVRRLEEALGEPGKSAKSSKKSKYDAEQPSDAQLALAAIGVREGTSPANCKLRIRGEPNELGDEVPRGFLTVLKTPGTPKIDPAHSGRLELAQWLVSRDNPLTVRVMANRIWFHLFGAGLVETVDNFGALGGVPSHPELLDHLAAYLMDHGWSVKQTIRAIVLSRTYQLAAAHDESNYAVDPENRLLWRMNRRRLDAEVIRDTALQASGRLDLNRPFGSLAMQQNGEVGRSIRTSVFQQDLYCRGVYLPAVRNATPEMLGVFDVADSSLVVGERDVTTVATQALYMLNSPFMLDLAAATAERLLADASLDAPARIEQAYRIILARSPKVEETARARAFLGDYASAEDPPRVAWAALAQVLFSSAEFRYAY